MTYVDARYKPDLEFSILIAYYVRDSRLSHLLRQVVIHLSVK